MLYLVESKIAKGHTDRVERRSNWMREIRFVTKSPDVPNRDSVQLMMPEGCHPERVMWVSLHSDQYFISFRPTTGTHQLESCV